MCVQADSNLTALSETAFLSRATTPGAPQTTPSAKVTPGRIHVKIAAKLNHFFLFSKLLVAVLGPVSVEELVSVENTPSARFAHYGI